MNLFHTSSVTTYLYQARLLVLQCVDVSRLRNLRRRSRDEAQHCRGMRARAHCHRGTACAQRGAVLQRQVPRWSAACAQRVRRCGRRLQLRVSELPQKRSRELRRTAALRSFGAPPVHRRCLLLLACMLKLIAFFRLEDWKGHSCAPI